MIEPATALPATLTGPARPALAISAGASSFALALGGLLPGDAAPIVPPQGKAGAGETPMPGRQALAGNGKDLPDAPLGLEGKDDAQPGPGADNDDEDEADGDAPPSPFAWFATAPVAVPEAEARPEAGETVPAAAVAAPDATRIRPEIRIPEAFPAKADATSVAEPAPAPAPQSAVSAAPAAPAAAAPDTGAVAADLPAAAESHPVAKPAAAPVPRQPKGRSIAADAPVVLVAPPVAPEVARSVPPAQVPARAVAQPVQDANPPEQARPSPSPSAPEVPAAVQPAPVDMPVPPARQAEPDAALAPEAQPPAPAEAPAAVTQPARAFRQSAAEAPIVRIDAPDPADPRIPVAPQVAAEAARPAAEPLGLLQEAQGWRRPAPREALPGEAAPIVQPGNVQTGAAVVAIGQAQQPELDTRRQEWTSRMIDTIEALRDATPVRETRLSLMPEGLGKVDIAIRQDDAGLHVHFSTETQAARQLIADAQPRLAEIAEQKGLRIGSTSVDSNPTGSNPGSANPGTDASMSQGQRQDAAPHHRHRPSAPAGARRDARIRTTSTTTDTGDDRIA